MSSGLSSTSSRCRIVPLFLRSARVGQAGLNESQRIAPGVDDLIQIVEQVALAVDLRPRCKLARQGEVGLEGGLDVAEEVRGELRLFRQQSPGGVSMPAGASEQQAAGPLGRSEFVP